MTQNKHFSSNTISIESLFLEVNQDTPFFIFLFFGLPGESFPRTQKMSHDNAFLLLLLVLRDAFFVFFGGLFSALYTGESSVCASGAGVVVVSTIQERDGGKKRSEP